MNRYMPPIVLQLIPDVVHLFGFAWAGLMFASAALNIVLAMMLDPLTWSATIAAWGIASKVVLFLIQYAAMRAIAVRRRRAESLPT
jgi:hypothetical protein